MRTDNNMSKLIQRLLKFVANYTKPYQPIVYLNDKGEIVKIDFWKMDNIFTLYE